MFYVRGFGDVEFRFLIEGGNWNDKIVMRLGVIDKKIGSYCVFKV